jgi:CRP/FNR family cyclic AMP-dependent transcriptional regulator
VKPGAKTMAVAERTRQRLCRVLEEDPDLCAAIPQADRLRASAHCLAPLLTVPRGKWKTEDMPRMVSGVGLLVVDGLLIRSVGVDGRFGAELLGAGDVLRPWQGEDLDSTVPITTGWRVIERSRMAVLDGRVATRLAAFPALTGAITARVLSRARRLGLMMAIVHHPLVEVRLHMLLWHLADRWGRVRPDGVLVPLRLSHRILGDLVAAQRPSVTGALQRLGRREVVQPMEQGWLLCGEPPWELLELQDVTVGEGEVASAGAGAG